ncbi:MAG TPA: tetratricopeptide repeat protein [Dongiaceae bacterium]|nr:tetratricopeptide repeat protein [Dongiaceae bacterium]
MGKSRRTPPLARLAAVVLAGVLASGCAVFGSVFGSSPEVAATTAPPAERSYDRGKSYFAQGKPALALIAFRQALGEESRSVRTLNGLAACYDRLRRFDLADRYYQQALTLDPRSAQTLNNLGYSHLLRGSGAGDLALARQYLEQARALDAGNTVVAANLARLVEQAPAAEAAPTVASLGGGISIVEPGAAWIERASAVEQRLVTAPDAAVVALARRVGVAPQIATVSLTSSCVGALDCNSLPRSGAVAARPTRLGPATQPAVDSPASGCADALDCMMPLRAGADAAQPPRVDPATQPTVGSPASGCADALDCILPNDSDSVTMPSRHIDYGLQLAAVQPAAGCANALDCMTPLRSGAEAASAEPPFGPAASTLT